MEEKNNAAVLAEQIRQARKDVNDLEEENRDLKRRNAKYLSNHNPHERNDQTYGDFDGYVY